MNIKTKHDIGDEIEINGQKYKILAIHLYESDNTHTERYYIGNQTFITYREEIPF